MIFRVFVCLFAIMLVSCKGETKKKLSEADQQKFEALIEEGKVLAKSNKFEEAIGVFKEAIKIDDTRVEANYGLGYALSKFCESDTSRCRESLMYYNKAIKIDENYRNSYFNRSFTRFMLDDFEGAMTDVDKAINAKPDEADYYIFRGSLYIAQEDTAKACVDLKKAAELGAKFENDLISEYCNK